MQSNTIILAKILITTRSHTFKRTIGEDRISEHSHFDSNIHISIHMDRHRDYCWPKNVCLLRTCVVGNIFPVENRILVILSPPLSPLAPDVSALKSNRLSSVSEQNAWNLRHLSHLFAFFNKTPSPCAWGNCRMKLVLSSFHSLILFASSTQPPPLVVSFKLAISIDVEKIKQMLHGSLKSLKKRSKSSTSKIFTLLLFEMTSCSLRIVHANDVDLISTPPSPCVSTLRRVWIWWIGGGELLVRSYFYLSFRVWMHSSIYQFCFFVLKGKGESSKN